VKIVPINGALQLLLALGADSTLQWYSLDSDQLKNKAV